MFVSKLINIYSQTEDTYLKDSPNLTCTVTDGKSSELETLYDSALQLLTIRKPGLSMASEWKISLL